ncbi:MAG: DUF1801 domain-containing protein [Bacteroidota bacterium]
MPTDTTNISGPFEEAFALILDALRTSLPPGFEEVVLNGMPTFVVPLSRYPAGYHCTPGKPLPFISIAARTSGISLHHLGLYSMPELLEWFTAEYPKYSRRKLDMGKGCVRFKKQDDIPLPLIQQLAARVAPDDWVSHYEKVLKR